MSPPKRNRLYDLAPSMCLTDARTHSGEAHVSSMTWQNAVIDSCIDVSNAHNTHNDSFIHAVHH
jgi:hypothetical protein